MTAPPHLAVPFQLGLDGVVSTNEQGTVDEVESNVRTVLSFPIGSFDPDPDFGIASILFQTIPVNTQAITVAVQEYEPRANIQTVEQSLQTDPLIVSIDATLQAPPVEET